MLELDEAIKEAGSDGAKLGDDPVFEIDEPTYNALTLFQAAQTQWKISDYGVRMGVDYSAIPVLERVHNIHLDDYSFRLFRIAETIVMNAESKRRIEQNAPSRTT